MLPLKHPLQGKRLLLLTAISLVTTSIHSSAQTNNTKPKPIVPYGNEKAITPARLKAHLELIASDELEGRDTPSRGLDIATLYVATQLKLWGATPAGDDGTFFQRVPMSQPYLDTTKSTIELGSRQFGFNDGFKAASTTGTASGKLVYVGHGYIVKKKNINPWAGVDVKGKIAVVALGMPKGVSQEDMKGEDGVDYAYPAGAAKKAGAVGLLTVPDAGYMNQYDANRVMKLGGISVDSDAPLNNSGTPNIIIGPQLTRAIFEGEGMAAASAMLGVDAPEKPFVINESKTLKVNVLARKEYSSARNVVAVVPGSDVKLMEEYVAYGAHIDHVGMASPGPGDRIYNGADDDGSGTVGVLEIAHAYLTGPRPKRSSLFVWHVGEEKGMWGSGYFVNHPTIPLKKIITQLNVDMIGRSKPEGDTKPANKVLTGVNEIYVVGSTKMSTDLQKTSEDVNASFLRLAFNYKYDDPKDPEAIFYRSDHYSYAQKGIPIIFYFDGVHEDYHQVSDEVSKIDFEKMAKVARTIYATGLTLSNAPKRPVVDKPLKN